MNNHNNKGLILSEYGTQLIPSSNLALLRGTGNYNPPPTFEQTTYRGPVYNQALNYYTKTNNLQQQTPVPMESLAQSLNYPNVIYPSDIQNKRNYVVGTSNMHPEKENSWKRPDFENSRGTSQYQVWAVNSLQMTPTVLMNLFFSDENVDYLQNKLVEEIMNIRGIRVQKQSIDELLIIMRNKYIYGISGYLPYVNEPSNKVFARGSVGDGKAYYKGSLEQQLMLLNKSVLEECIKQVLSGITEYERYYKDSSSLPMPLEPPVMASSKGSKELVQTIGFESGIPESIAVSSFNQRFNII